ncbi:MAG: hypothetical protein JJU13_13725 [Balneolaceae bacterium]|nr:hypothetical protein [Balneolaceae bacterium]
MGLRNSLICCINSSNHTRELRRLIEECHSIALAYLKMKASANKLFLFHGEDLKDLAWDFIAESFEKDIDGRLIKFQEYFDGYDLNEMTEPEITFLIRKLIFTKVEDNLFRAIGERDPSLRKIIRNLKLAIRESDCEWRVCFNNGDLVIEKGLNNLPKMPSEFMQIKLSQRLDKHIQIPDILIEVIDIMMQQSEYQKRFSLIGLAIIIREIFVHFNSDKIQDKVIPDVDLRLLNGEFDEFLERSVKSIRFTVGYNYIRKNKMSIKSLNAYMNASKEIVKEHFIGKNNNISHYECLKEQMPALEYNQFRTHHRQKLEYLVKLVRADLVRVYKQDWA